MSAAIIPIADYLPQYWAEDLLAEVERDRDRLPAYHRKPVDEFIIDLGAKLSEVIDLALVDIDIKRTEQTNIALALQCLAAITLTLEGHGSNGLYALVRAGALRKEKTGGTPPGEAGRGELLPRTMEPATKTPNS